MRSFIDEVVASLYERYGDDISSLTLLFPSRRAQLFFTDSLSKITLRPVWQPKFAAINDLMQQIAEIRCGDRIKLVTELYKVYSRYHHETFDQFYFWGDMLLSDFDQIDKYLINADMLFTNISDLRELENYRDYLTPEQTSVRRANFPKRRSSLCPSGERSEQFITSIDRRFPTRDLPMREWCTVWLPSELLPMSCQHNSLLRTVDLLSSDSMPCQLAKNSSLAG